MPLNTKHTNNIEENISVVRDKDVTITFIVINDETFHSKIGI